MKIYKQTVKVTQADIVNLYHVGGTDFSIKVILEPIPLYSEAGGSISVFTEYASGSHFFSHVGEGTFNSFIAQCEPDYLIRKLFNCPKTIPVTSTNEIIEWIALTDFVDYIKEARNSKLVSKAELRKCYDLLKDGEDYYDYNLLISELEGTFEMNVIQKIFGGNFTCDYTPYKHNHMYKRLEMLIKAYLDYLKSIT